MIQLNEPFLYPAEHDSLYLHKHFGRPQFGMHNDNDEAVEPGKEKNWAAIRERAGRARLQAERDIVDAMRIRRHREALARGWTDEPLASSVKVDEERGEEALIQQEIEAAERASMEAAMRDQSVLSGGRGEGPTFDGPSRVLAANTPKRIVGRRPNA